MKTDYILTAIALSFAIGASTGASAQTTQQTVQQQTVKQKPNIPTAQSIKAQMDRRAHALATAPFRTVHVSSDAGTEFTDSHLRSITRAGTIGNETGTSGSDANGQIGTTNQGDMTRVSTQGALFTSHFGSGGSRSKPAKPTANKRDNANSNNNNISKNP